MPKGLQFDPPRHPIRLQPLAAQLAADLDQMMGHALGQEIARYRIDGKPLRDRAEIE
jgi:hypothetical protein